MAVSIEERLSKVEGVVSEHDRIFDMLREELRGLREYIDGRIDDTNTRIDDLREEVNRRFDEAREQTNRRFDEMDKRIDKLDGRIDKLDGRMDKLDGRLDAKTDKLDRRIDETNKKLDSNFKWLVAIQVTTLIAIIGMGVSITLAILPK